MAAIPQNRHVQSLFLFAILLVLVILSIFQSGYETGKDKALQENRRADAMAAVTADQ